MTVAICIECGSTKHGALTPCPDCGFAPSDDEAKAKSMIATDHFLSSKDLAAVGQRIVDGLPVNYPKEAVDNFIKMFEENPRMEAEASRFIYGCVAMVVLAIFAVAYAFYWWTG